MASRAFSTSVKRLKKLKWRLNGTTVDVTWLTEQIEETIDNTPGLEDVTDAQVNGNPHPTPGKNDPYHGSVELYNQAGQRLTSAHGYPNGYVKFSKENKFKPVKLPPHPKAPAILPSGPTDSKSDSKK